MSIRQIKKELRAYADPEKKAFYPRFFKTGKGEYGEGDRFLGVTVPLTRKVAKSHKDASWAVLEALVASPWHEERLLGFLILIQRFEKGDESAQKVTYQFVHKHRRYINNWDLVDAVAPKIIGPWYQSRSRRQLAQWVKSKNLWERRIAVMATFPYIKEGDFKDILAFSQQLLKDQEDLIHKAVGWMLREMGKVKSAELYKFLDQHAHKMPRTMLRYSLEKVPSPKKRQYMNQ